MGALILQQAINALTVGRSTRSSRSATTMVYGVLRLINFAHSELFTAGAFIGLALAGRWALPATRQAGCSSA